jgi:hypothetical protein
VQSGGAGIRSRLLPPDLPQRNSRRLIESIIDNQASLTARLDDGFDDCFFDASRRQTYDDAVTDFVLALIARLFVGWHAGECTPDEGFSQGSTATDEAPRDAKRKCKGPNCYGRNANHYEKSDTNFPHRTRPLEGWLDPLHRRMQLRV